MSCSILVGSYVQYGRVIVQVSMGGLSEPSLVLVAC